LYCVFTDPQLGGVGMTEKEAREKGFKLKSADAHDLRGARHRARPKQPA